MVLLSGWMRWDLWSPALKCFPGRGGFICSMLCFVIAFFFLKCLIQLDQRIQYQNAIARNLAHILNSPQQGDAPSA